MNKKVIIIGSGGHAKVIIDIIQGMKKYEIIGVASSDKIKRIISGVPILGNDSILIDLYKSGVKHAFIAIGDCKLRDIIFNYVNKIGFDLVNAISPSANISPTVKIGFGVAIMPGVSINVDSIIEDNVIINTNASIDHDNVIKKSVHIAPGCNLAGNVTVGEGTFLGIGCKVIPKIFIGKWSTIGAGSVVIKDVPSNTVVFGVPAKVIKNNNSKSHE